MNIRPSTLSLSLCAAILIAWIASTGCHRSYYRRQADNEARLLIREKLNDPRWNQVDPSIAIPEDSRMFDPFSSDHPPMPGDDPASHELMHCVDNKPGYENWHVNGDTRYVESPEWRSWLPLDENGVLQLDMQTAVQLSLIHSSELQQQRENLYLSALDVSLERFGFDLQAFYGWNSFFRTQGRSNPTGTATSFSASKPGGRTQIEKLGINGASLVVGLANSVIWNFSGANTQTATTLLDFSLVQPLLRGAGREIIMESLTQAERDLLGDVRQMERFRRGFYLSVVTGRNPGAGPRSNFLNEPSGANFNAGGFMGLLQTQQEIRISEFNVNSLENVLTQFREFFNEQRINLLQVRQAENTLYRAQQSLLRLKVQYENELDQFKRDLGLPPDLPIEIRDPFLEQFELIDDSISARQLAVNVLRDEIGLALEKLSPIDEDGEIDPDAEVEWSPEMRDALLGLIPVFEKLRPFFDQLEGPDRELVEEDFNRLESVTAKRREELLRLQKVVAESETQYQIEPSLLQPESIVSADQLRMEMNELQGKITGIKGLMEVVIANINRLVQEGESLPASDFKNRLEDEVIYDAPEVVTKLADAILEITLLQARARTNSISLPEIEIDSATASAIAAQFRRDLMNARAALVDQWRQIELAADDLESQLDVVFEGSVGNTTDNPFELNWNTNRFGMGLRFDAPITRLAERNQYRQTLINYQRARRDFYNFEDAIKQNLRQTLRAIDQSKVVFELDRRSIAVAVEQVELARFDLIQPVRPGQGGGQTTLGPTAARDLTNALNDLQSAQNSFLNQWVSYEVARRGLDFDLGTMQLTPNGDWLDPGTINAQYAERAAEAFGMSRESICLPGDPEYIDPNQYLPAIQVPDGFEELPEDSDLVLPLEPAADNSNPQ